MDWPDILVGLVLAYGTYRGWRVGLIAELTGIIALGVAIVAAFTYPGTFDGFVHQRMNLGPGSAHVVGLCAYAGIAYAIVAAIGYALGRIAQLPLIGTVHAALGAALGLAKSTLFVWVVLYVALFFPLSRDLRKDLHHSWLVGAIASENAGLDGTLRSSLRNSLPSFVQPYSDDIFARHRV